MFPDWWDEARVEAVLDALVVANSTSLTNTSAMGSTLDTFAALVAMGRTTGKVVAISYIAAIAPKRVSMADALASHEFAIAKAFITVARSQTQKPTHTYAEIEVMVRSIGLQPWQVINFTEEMWNVAANRHIKAGQVLMYILTHLQGSCAGMCGASFEDYRASCMNGIHFDHRDPSTKNEDDPSPGVFANFTPEVAIEEWKKCESTCVACHDQAEKAGGKLRPKRKTKTKTETKTR